MLGYLVGLGDRHGENILLDTDSGRLDHAGTRLEHLQNLYEFVIFDRNLTLEATMERTD